MVIHGTFTIIDVKTKNTIDVLYLYHLLLEAGEGELVGADEPEQVVVLEDDMTAGIDDSTAVTLDSYHHGVMLGS